MLYSLFYSFFSATAWSMEQPSPGSPFHLLITLLGLAAAAKLAFFLGRTKPEKILFSCGLLLLLSELYKQGFLYIIINHGQFNWWYFPFQLCSIPMYLCLLYPFIHHRKSAGCIIVFLQDFALLGGIMALLVPDGFLWPYWTLTMHGFFWHFLLVFLSLYCRCSGLSRQPALAFRHGLPIYFIGVGIAVLINTCVQFFVYPQGYADMFYINCFFPSEQPFFSEISATLGNFWGHFAYILASCLGAGLIHFLYEYCSRTFTAAGPD